MNTERKTDPRFARRIAMLKEQRRFEKMPVTWTKERSIAASKASRQFFINRNKRGLTMSLSKQFAVDNEKEVQGVVVQFGQNDDGSIPGFHIARMSRSNTRYTRALEAATRPYRRQIELGTMANDVAERVFRDVFVDTVLKGWENVLMSDVTGDSSKSGFAQFNKQNAVALFERLPELYDDLQAQAKSAALFKDDEQEAEAKN